MRKIDDVAHQLQYNKEHGRSCVLLIGAGCSVSAGIPTASEIVKRIEREYRHKYQAAKTKDYPGCMKRLALDERHDLIAEYVAKALINPAHVFIAQLIKAGYVDRVLTPNFDPLVVKACALFNEFPAAYDVMAMDTYRKPPHRGNSVFHLHGKHDGYYQAHSRDEVSSVAKVYDGLFEDVADRRTWIVVGYSGGNDPVFEKLKAIQPYGLELFWSHFGAPMPTEVEALFAEGTNAFRIDGYDADQFFGTLAEKLGCAEPPFLNRPFSHLKEVLQTITWFADKEQPSTTLIGEGSAVATPSFVPRAMRQIEKAIGCVEPHHDWQCSLEAAPAGTPIGSELAERLSLLTRTNDYDAMIAFAPEAEKSQDADALVFITWALVMKAKQATGEVANRLWTEAEDKCRQALLIRPETCEALINWGAILDARARTKTGDEASDLIAQASDKYRQALAIKPDMPSALTNWSNALIFEARQSPTEEAEVFLANAEEKCHRANDIKPGHGSYNLACIAALRVRPDDCRIWLEDSLRHGFLPDRAHIEKDTDLDSVRSLPWFSDILAQAH
ncbi:MAG: TPR end-of-group domain-containing protein [Actinomycetota bacterium]